MKTSLFLMLLLCGTVSGYDYSEIDIFNRVGGYPSGYYNAIHTNYWPATDGLDVDYGEDNFLIGESFCQWSGCGFVCSAIGDGQYLQYDYRSCNGAAPYRLKLSFCGTLDVESENSLWVNYGVDEYSETFDDKTLCLRCDRLRYGFIIDVRRVIEISSVYGYGIVELENVPAGVYGVGAPYGTAILYITERSGPSPLSDLDEDGASDLTDLAIMAKDWLVMPQGKYRGDVSGPDEIPDGYVNFYDLAKWLMNQ